MLFLGIFVPLNNNHQLSTWSPTQHSEIKWRLPSDNDNYLKNLANNQTFSEIVYNCINFPKSETQHSFEPSERLMLMDDESEQEYQVCVMCYIKHK